MEKWILLYCHSIGRPLDAINTFLLNRLHVSFIEELTKHTHAHAHTHTHTHTHTHICNARWWILNLSLFLPLINVNRLQLVNKDHRFAFTHPIARSSGCWLVWKKSVLVFRLLVCLFVFFSPFCWFLVSCFLFFACVVLHSVFFQPPEEPHRKPDPTRSKMSRIRIQFPHTTVAPCTPSPH